MTFVVQAAAWSCSWDVNNSYYVYAGLQVLPYFLRENI